MGATLKQEAEKAAMETNISMKAKAAAQILEGWGAVSRVGFFAISALSNKIELAIEARNDRSARDLHLIDIGTDEVVKASKINPLMWKPQLEQIAVLALRDAGMANSKSERAAAKVHFENFAQAITDARTAGPISDRTLAKILDKVDEFRTNSSFMHMALDLKSDLRFNTVEILLSAKVNPNFRVSQSDPSPMVIALELHDDRVSEALNKSGATISMNEKSPRGSAEIRSEYSANYLMSKMKRPASFENLAPPRPLRPRPGR